MPNPEMNEYDIRPAMFVNWMKVVMTFIDRIGFPVLAFLLMSYLLNDAQKQNAALSITITQQTEIMRRIEARLNK